MKLNIGENIRKLRKERDITQEEFSEMLGVSCQSVSRWENGTCYPDIELIPIISEFFGISTDKLMGLDIETEKIAVENYQAEFQKAISKGDTDECLRISRKAVAEYPNNYALLNQLMYALFILGSDDADIPNWKENMEKYDDEIISLGERIAKYCPDTEIRNEATARLAFQHCEMGRKEKGRAIYESLPSLTWHIKELAIWEALNEEEKIPHLYKSIKIAYEILDVLIWRLEKMLPPTDAIKVIEKENALSDIIHDGETFFGSWANTNTNFNHAKYLAQLGQTEDAIKRLETAAKAAIAFDNRPDAIFTESILLGKRTIEKDDFETADSRPLRVILRDSWLKSNAFDGIRDTDKFKDIIELLS